MARATRVQRWFRVAVSAVMASNVACSGSAEAVSDTAEPVVYGADDRYEYYDVADDAIRQRLAASVVALIAKSNLRQAGGGVSIESDTWGEQAQLCPGERFADQPAAAFCTGVLLDWDKVLIAAHCAHRLPLAEFSVVFGYYYRAPEELALDARDIFQPIEVIAEALDGPAAETRLDYAWLRLSQRVAAPRAPAPVHILPPEPGPVEPLLFVGASGGVPLKADMGALLRDARLDSGDYFIADTDSSHGASGGGAFGRHLELLGILARGGSDFNETTDGCRTSRRVPSALAEEQFTYAFRAVEGVCRNDPTSSSLCRADCPNPCLASAQGDFDAALGSAADVSGCSAGRGRVRTPWLGVAVLLPILIRRRARRRVSGQDVYDAES
jgi:hypothetical protein